MACAVRKPVDLGHVRRSSCGVRAALVAGEWSGPRSTDGRPAAHVVCGMRADARGPGHDERAPRPARPRLRERGRRAVVESVSLPRERHLMVVPDLPPPRERAAGEALIDVALVWTRLWLWPLGYRVRVERREPKFP